MFYLTKARVHNENNCLMIYLTEKRNFKVLEITSVEAMRVHEMRDITDVASISLISQYYYF